MTHPTKGENSNINRKIRVGFLEYGGIEDGLSEKDRLKIDKSGKFGKRRD